MSEKGFMGGMILVGITIFLIVSMIIQSCEADYKLIKEDNFGDDVYICCHKDSTGYDSVNEECIGAPDDAKEGKMQKDLLGNIKIISPHTYMIIIIAIMGLAVIGASLMIG